MKSFEGQYSLQAELDRAGSREDYLKKQKDKPDSSETTPIDSINENQESEITKPMVVKDTEYYANLAKKHGDEIIKRIKEKEAAELEDPHRIDKTGRDKSNSDSYQIYGHYDQFKDENKRRAVGATRRLK